MKPLSLIAGTERRTISGASLRSAGDKARDLGNWVEAVENYSTYLRDNPRDFAILVQLGHAHKECGSYDRALAAYDRAAEINPSDFDLHLNRGHLLKLLGDREGAISAYKKSYEVNPSNDDAISELIALQADLSMVEVRERLQEEKTIYLDVTDLVDYAKLNASLSGIQRVVSNLLCNIEHYLKGRKGLAIVPVMPEYHNMRVFSLSKNLLLRMIQVLREAGVDRPRLDKAIEAVLASRAPVEPERGDIFAIAGAFWVFTHYDMLRRLRDNGVAFVLFVHDLIQISHPEFVFEAATRQFRHAIAETLMLVNGILTNSEFVAEDVRKFLSERTNLDLPVKAVPLATELPPLTNKSLVLSQNVRDVIGDPYVLSVATIEVRKNHMYMVRIWERLIKNQVPNIPNLIFVGKLGWDIKPFLDYIEGSDQLEGRLRILRRVTDFELSELYKHAMFTMFPSFVEGFGLPVGESLAYGKPCISSDRASMPEVGGKFARYVNPDDVNEGYNLVRELLENPQELERWTREIATSHKPKAWLQFSTEFFDAAAELSKEDKPLQKLLIEPADIVGMGRAEVKRRDELNLTLPYLESARGAGWHAVETWGCWTSSRRATLTFATRLPPHTAVAIYLSPLLPAGTDSDKVWLKVDAGGVCSTIRAIRVEEQLKAWHVVEGRTGPDGDVSIVFMSAGPFAQDGNREMFVGLKALAYCESSDSLSRVKILEKIMLG
jgi:glycosyltransferase involved in cell wall biosynthesis